MGKNVLTTGQSSASVGILFREPLWMPKSMDNEIFGLTCFLKCREIVRDLPAIQNACQGLQAGILRRGEAVRGLPVTQKTLPMQTLVTSQRSSRHGFRTHSGLNLCVPNLQIKRT